MPRIHVQPAEHYPFATEIQIYISHVNECGHLDNAQLLTLVSEARVRFFNWLGYRELDVGGSSFVVADLVAQYKSEGYHGEVMCVAMSPDDFNRYGFDLRYRMTETRSGREVALGKIGVVFIDPVSRKVTPVPPALLNRIQTLCGAPHQG